MRYLRAVFVIVCGQIVCLYFIGMFQIGSSFPLLLALYSFFAAVLFLINNVMLKLNRFLFCLLLFIVSGFIAFCMLIVIGTIQIGNGVFDSLLEQFFLFTFKPKNDPLSIIVMFFMTLPVLLIYMPLIVLLLSLVTGTTIKDEKRY